ncbi:DUF2232 domain-containing protein [Pyruvatibacter mobilis]|uniref:DUF2232 domain-containing protein n=1 Tax=Pyruvatibacter mobilis TaxID=1712261 RepID=UPI003BAD77D1
MGNLPPWVIGVLAGLASSTLYAAASGGATPAIVLLYLSPLPIFIAGLGWGTLMALIAGGTGLVLTSLFNGISSGVVYLAVEVAAPLWLMRLALTSRAVGGRGASAAARAARAREAHHRAVAAGEIDGPPDDLPEPEVTWYPPGLLVVWTTAIAASLLLISILSMTVTENGLRGAIMQMINTGIVDTGELGRVLDARGFDISPRAFLAGIASFVPAMAASLWLIMTLANMMVAQLILVRLGRAARPTPSIAELRYPKLFLAIFPASLLFAFLPGEAGFAGASLAAVLFIPYFLLGLATIHAISRRWQARSAALTGFYTALVLLSPLVAVLVGCLGLADAWMGLRERYAPDLEAA